MRFDFLKGRVSFDMLQHWLFSNGIDMLSRFECPKHGVFPRTAVFLPRETGCTCGILCQFLVRSMRSPSRGRTKYASKKIRIDPQRWFMKRFFSCRGNFRNLGYVSEICSNILECLISFFFEWLVFSMFFCNHAPCFDTLLPEKLFATFCGTLAG